MGPGALHNIARYNIKNSIYFREKSEEANKGHSNLYHCSNQYVISAR